MGEALASLPQYDLPEIRKATDAWWQGIARHLRREGISDVPDRLTRPEDGLGGGLGDGEALWRHPDLILTQTCGYPLMTELQDHLRPVARPIYDCDGCDGPTYASAIIVASDSPYHSLEDLRGTRAAINNWNSHSGMNALRHSIAPLARDGRFFSEVIVSGGHALSIAAVQSGRADTAAIDSVTLALLTRHAPDKVAGIRRLCWTASAPSLPYATNIRTSAETQQRLTAGLIAAAADVGLKDVCDVLLITGFSDCDLGTYQTMLDLKTAAAKSEYPHIG